MTCLILASCYKVCSLVEVSAKFNIGLVKSASPLMRRYLSQPRIQKAR